MSWLEGRNKQGVAGSFLLKLRQKNIITVRYYSLGYSSDFFLLHQALPPHVPYFQSSTSIHYRIPNVHLLTPLSTSKNRGNFLKNVVRISSQEGWIEETSRGWKKEPKDFHSNKLSIRVLFVLIVQKYKDCI